jgi:hypothetical protein
LQLFLCSLQFAVIVAALLESIGYYLVDLLAVGLGNQHRGGICCSSEGSMLEGAVFGRKAIAKCD